MRGLLVVLTMLVVLGTSAIAIAQVATVPQPNTNPTATQPSVKKKVPCLRGYPIKGNPARKCVLQTKIRRCRTFRQRVNENRCLVQAAAWFYRQDPQRAARAANCESSFDHRNSAGPYRGLFQFDWGTWAETPFGGKFGQRAVWNPVYNALGAMWFWARGAYRRWPVCAYR